jgi:membrane protease subunit HflK
MDWTPPPKGTGGGPNADLNQVLEEIKKKLPSFKKSKGLGIIILVVLLFALGSSAYFTVEPEETGVVLRFGKFVREAGPGLHFKLPLGIEKDIKVKTGRVLKEEFGFRGISPGVRSRFAEEGYADESLMLTGDLNVIDMKWVVQYQIREPRKWLFEVVDGRSAIRDLSESVMRAIVGNRLGELVLTTERGQVAELAQRNLQALLNQYQTGVLVVTLKLQDVNPPGPVKASFNEVNEARQQKERMINEADEIYKREIAKASGDAERMVKEAEGYATEEVNRAQGEATRFNKVLAAYRQAEDVTKRRFYLEAMEKIIKQAGKVYVVDEDVKGLLPMMNLGKGMAGKAVQQ